MFFDAIPCDEIPGSFDVIRTFDRKVVQRAMAKDAATRYALHGNEDARFV